MIKKVSVNLGLLRGCCRSSKTTSKDGILLFSPLCKLNVSLMNSSRGLVNIRLHM